jgi:uncharacterized membrane protein YgcG
MKPLFLILSFTLLSLFNTYAQTAQDASGTHDVSGTIVDSTKLSLPGSSIKLVSNSGDSTISIADANGKFIFAGVKGSKITLTISSIGFTAIKKHFALNDDGKPVDLGNIILQSQTNMLNQVTIVGAANPITLKEDTVVYNAGSYKVRENAPAEDLLKKLPGVDVDVNGNITTQGKQVTKVRINGKDYMGGDVQSATKNLPADIIENIQMIDDYGDQANLTGVKTGEPDKIMNITIRKDKNYGYTGQATAGDGEDALPKSQGIPNQNRYIGSLNVFTFNGDQQVAVQGSFNNTNVNTFSFGSVGGSGGRGGGGNFGGGGGRGNAGRGGANSGSLITAQNGITVARSIGVNFRDQWSKSLSVYGSYSFADNTTSTTNNIFQQNTSPTNPSEQQQYSLEKDQNINHRFTWNMEYKPDTVNYLKVTPTFSYAGTNTNEADSVSLTQKQAITSAYNSITNGDSQAPNYGISALYNHRFPHRRNLSIFANASSAPSWSFQNPIYNYTAGTPAAPVNQLINTYSRTNSYGVNLSYLEPLGKRSYLELNYAFNHSVTANNKETDTLSNANSYNRYDLLSNQYNYTFTTNKVGLNYRFVEKKYNYTLGIGVQPSVLDGDSPLNDIETHRSTFNIIPTARFVYNFSRSKAFSVNYNGSNAAPTFSQLQPVVDFSNALYPVIGNPNLNPAFTNNVSIRYNNFSFTTGNVFFANFSYQQINNQVVTNTITSNTSNRILTQYLNADGYYNVSGRITYAKPWAQRKYSLIFNGTATYNNNVGYLTNVNLDPLAATQAEIDAARQKNLAKNLVLTPELRFRVDITNIIDAQILSNYAINRTSNSVKNEFNDGLSNVRTWNLGINGKNYFGDWVFSYDYTKATNYGYASNIQVTNPNILNLYVERRFLKNKVATIRLSGFDLFNENTGFTSVPTASSITQTRVNRLARYYLLTFTLRLQKFAGKAPAQDDRGGRGFRDGGGRRDGGGGPEGGSAPGVPGGPQ